MVGPYSKVTMKGEGKLPFDFKFIYASDIVTDTSAEIVLTIDADMNAFMAMMAASPLQNFVNMLAAKLKEVMESMA